MEMMMVIAEAKVCASKGFGHNSSWQRAECMNSETSVIYHCLGGKNTFFSPDRQKEPCSLCVSKQG